MENKTTVRRWASCVALITLGVALAFAIQGLVWWLRQDSAGKRDTDTVEIWLHNSVGLLAEDADNGWQAIQARIALGNLPSELRVQPYSTLGDKYFAEGKYDRAFEMYDTECRLSEIDPDGFVLYLAGLAGCSDWLTKLAEKCRGKELTDPRARLIQANLAWIAADDQRVLLLTDKSGFPNGPAIQQAEQGFENWLLFLRAKALDRQRRYADAFQVLDQELDPNWYKPWGDKMLLHFAEVDMGILERAGHLRSALYVADSMCEYFGIFYNKSWTRTRLYLAETMGRLKWRISQIKPEAE